MITLCSIAAAAWLAATTTTEAIRQEHSAPVLVANDATIYDTLLGYAATHPRWAGVAPELASDPGIGGIDPRAVGPFLLPGPERGKLLDVALKSLDCLRSNYGFSATLSIGPSGRPTIEVAGGASQPSWLQYCAIPALDQPTVTEEKALERLDVMVDACLAPAHQYVKLLLGFGWATNNQVTKASGQPVNGTGSGVTPGDRQIQSCIDASRRTQLRPYVAPPALLFITGPAATVTAVTWTCPRPAALAWRRSPPSSSCSPWRRPSLSPAA